MIRRLLWAIVMIPLAVVDFLLSQTGFLRWAIVISPAAAVLVALAVPNRQPVTVSFNPFDSSDPDLAVTVPLYLVGFTVLIAGVVLGGIAAWLKQGKHRRTSSRLAAENVKMRSELAYLKGEMAKRNGRSPTHPTGAANKTLPAA
jgi:uncharacterized integral membrane protein